MFQPKFFLAKRFFSNLIFFYTEGTHARTRGHGRRQHWRWDGDSGEVEQRRWGEEGADRRGEVQGVGVGV